MTLMNEHYIFEVPPLPYPYDALEPYIDTETMKMHHDRYLTAYVDNLNRILSAYPEYQNLSLEQLLIYADSLPEAIQIPVKRNAGGVYNHIFFFQGVSSAGMKRPANPLASYITSSFGNFDAFKKAFTDAALSVFGSGYAWLTLDCFGKLKIITTANQDTPFPLKLYPILNLDVWEHAYILKHINQRADYIGNWFEVINWTQAGQNLTACFLSDFI